MDDYLDDFVQESEERITELNNALLELESDPDDDDAIEQLFRTAHTLKGNCGALGFTTASSLAHAIEDLLESVRDGSVQVDADTMDLLFEAVDLLETILEQVGSEEETSVDPGETVRALRITAADLEPPEEDAIEDALEVSSEPSAGDRVYHLRLGVEDEPPESELDDMGVLDALEDAFEVLGTLPDREQVESDERTFDAIVSSAIEAEDLATALEGVERVDAVIVTDVTDLAGVDGPELDPDDVDVDDLLAEFDEYDDLDDPDTDVDDVELDDLGDAGTFEFSDPVEVNEAANTFEELRSEVEQAEFEEFAHEIDEQFDEFEDEVEFEDLLAEGPDSTDATATDPDAAGEDVGEDEGPFEPDATADDVEEADGFSDLDVDEDSIDVLAEFGSEFDESDDGLEEIEELQEGEFEGFDVTEELPSGFTIVDDTPTQSEDDHSIADIQSVRVGVDQVDSLLNLVEELVTNRIRLRRAIETGDIEQALSDLSDLETTTAELQDTVMDVRLVPLDRVASRLPRIVRDVARDQGKEVEFVTEGTDVELDRSILSEIGDPLMHIVRNAVGHGIEPPGERESAGKDPTGTVRLRTRRSRDRVTIVVEDDGRGIDPDAIRERAVENGLLSSTAADALDDESVYELVFQPGFTTADSVTDLSGRGVGMDVVRTTVRALDGSVSIESTPGEGTAIRLRLPVSVAIVQVLFVEAGEETFGIPITDIEEIDRDARTETIDGEEVLAHEERPYPVVHLDDALEVTSSETEARATDGAGAGYHEGVVIRIDDDVRRVALRCDGVLRQEEVVVKPFEGLLRGIPGLSGAAVLGEGDVVTILDVETL